MLAAAMMAVGLNSAWAQVTVPTPAYFNDFTSTDGLTIVGNGEFITDADPAFGKVFHNDPANASAKRTNYLRLPNDALSHSATSNEMTIGFWVNKKGENDFFFTPLFAAYGTAPTTENTTPMFVCETRGLIQLNCSGYCDFGINSDPAGSTYNDGTPYVNTAWLDDGAWHYYTVVLTATTAKVYIDGELKNGWTVDGTSDGQKISGLFSDGSSLTYVTLGGNQAWSWSDPDPAFAFDDFAVYNAALSAEQIAKIISDKGKAASTYSISYDFKSFVGAGVTSSAFTNSTTSVTGYTTLYKPVEFSDELGGKFAFQDGTKWTLRNTDSDKGLCWNDASDRHFSIVGLKAGDKVTVTTSAGKIYFGTANQCTGVRISKNDEGSGTYVTELNGANAQWDQLKSGATLTMLKDGTLNLQCKKTWVCISSVVIEPSQAENVSTPSITSESTDGGRNVTITSGSSNMLSGVTTYYTTDGTTPTSSSTKYTGTFLQTTTATVKAITISNSSAATVSEVTEQLVNLDVVDNPVMTVTGTSDNSRIVTVTCATDGATIYYSETEKTNAEEGWSTYSGPVTTAATTLYAYAGKGATKSAVVNIPTGAGTTISLLAATVAHTAANAYTISHNQSSLLGAPTATVHYQIDGGAEQTSTATSVVIPVSADGTLTYWLTADGYGATAPVNESIYAEVAYAITTTLDFCTNSTNSAMWAYNNNTAYDKSGIGVTTDDDTRYYYKYLDQSGNIVGDGVLAVSAVYGGQSWRIDKNSGGVHPYNKTEYLAVLDLTAGQIVQIKCSSAPAIVSSNISVVPAATYTGTYTYVVNTAGDAIVSLGKDYGLTKVYICSTSVSATLGANGYATFASAYPLDLTTANLPSGVTAYKAAVSGTTVTFTPLDQTVPANTGVLLKGPEDAEVSIPVVASGTDVTENAFLVNTAGTTFAADDGYTYFGMMKAASSSDAITFGTFAPATVAIPANKAYLKVLTSSIATAPSLTFIFDDGQTTGIESVKSEDRVVNGSAEYYNLAGQRVAQPTKGLYIVNGRKVVVK